MRWGLWPRGLEHRGQPSGQGKGQGGRGPVCEQQGAGKAGSDREPATWTRWAGRVGVAARATEPAVAREQAIPTVFS